MGYRSSVLIAFAGPRDKLTAFFVKARFDAALAPAFSEFQWKEGTHGDNAVRFIEEGETRWYSSYPDVQAMEQLWALAADSTCEELPIYGRFVRIGEDDSDTETKTFGDDGGDGYDLASVHRSIEHNIELKEKADD
jgi:hypothetical protein